MFFKVGILKIFAKFTLKRLCQSLFFSIKLQVATKNVMKAFKKLYKTDIYFGPWQTSTMELFRQKAPS